MNEPTYEELKSELERVRKERDALQESLRDLIKRHFDIDIDEVEAELRAWQKNGTRSTVTLDELIAELESKLGPAA
jgi:uncharacterized coiled-coil DUF342 family protein